jgi:diguanylate cyclase (GGDEF)-like protein
MLSLLNELIAFRGYRPRILVVDDQTVNIRVIHELFKDECEVLIALSGAQAITQCQEHRPDLVLLDVMMPGIDGHEVCRRLKADPDNQLLPIIFLTAQHEEADEALGFELGAVDFITKPINKTIVLARVRTHLALKLQSDFLKSIALTDGLTGVANRRRFDEDLPLSWKHCARSQQHISLMMIDIDYFKRYNDKYGHLQGDSCLRKIAQAIKDALQRPGDLTARYGGEEFVCVMPDTDARGAEENAQRVLENVRALKIEHALSEVDQFATVSIGVSIQIATPGGQPDGLVIAADQQLYEAKRQGRARVSTIDLR